jgi:hypothetical protein
MDGNGRFGPVPHGRRLPWTVIPLERRDAYMAALEEASARQNIEPFADFPWAACE